MRRASRTVIEAVIALSAIFAVLAACGSDDNIGVDRAKLAQKCFIDSDCDSPLRCAFQKCHVECESSRDCTQFGADARCVISNRPFNVCQLPEERSCKYNSECPEGQRCAIDEQCRDQCRSDRDCVQGQVCTTGTCAEPSELQPDGTLKNVADAATSDGVPCAYNSDCPVPLACRNGSCAFQCKTDRDCASNEKCEGNVCMVKPIATDGGVCTPITCAMSGRNCGASLDGCGGVIKCGPTGSGNSDCAGGETCGGGGPNVCGKNTCTPLTCQQAGKNCGAYSDGCSGVLDCGTCPSGTTCGGGGIPNVCGCTPDNTAACAGKNCGEVVNNCGQTVSCGSCPAPSVCGAGGVANQCACVPKTCASLGKNCGMIPDGCGGTLNCGACQGGTTCGGGGTPNVCGNGTCSPLSCDAQGAKCGQVSDGCGAVLTCGDCTVAGQTCGGAGTPNVCGCAPKTCAQLGRNCGPVSDSCGQTLSCGDCASPQSCGGGGIAGRCGCTATTCAAAGKNCGVINDGCGSLIACGSCPAGQTCGGSGIPNVCAAPSVGKSCQGSPLRCGPTQTDDCCASATVPTGVWNRRNTNTGPDGKYPAKVSAYKLDVYEVTVARFRAFLNATQTYAFQSSPPPAGAGANSSIPPGTNTGWDPAWNSQLPLNVQEWNSRFAQCGSNATWTATAGPRETHAINCVDWYEAFAFCAWDGGRLPTENEWQYAFTGGSEYRYYPWSDPPTSNTYSCSYDDVGCGGPFAVGSQIYGAAKWGQKNMNGGMREWVFDWYKDPFRYPDCSQVDCADGVPQTGNRVIVGGSWLGYIERSETRFTSGPNGRNADWGVRCARNL